MPKIGLISDTHSYLDERIIEVLQDCDEVWHAGDIGSVALFDRLHSLDKVFRTVHGNIDNATIRLMAPAELEWELEGKRFYMTHIGGAPGKYAKGIKSVLMEKKPDVFICGHSHILRVIFDKQLNLLYLNPGACGKEGFHKVRTMLKFSVTANKISDMAVIEFPK